MVERIEPVSEEKGHIRFLSECRFQTESSVVRDNTLHQGSLAFMGREERLELIANPSEHFL